MSSNPSSVVTIYQFSQLLSIVWSQAMTPRTIMSGFKATSIFLLNWYAITLPGECPRLSNTPTAILAKKDISFMPFYSPTHATRQLFTSEEQEIEYKGWFEGESEGGIVCSWRRESGRWVSKELYLKTFWVIGLNPQVVPFIISQVIAFFITTLKTLFPSLLSFHTHYLHHQPLFPPLFGRPLSHLMWSPSCLSFCQFLLQSQRSQSARSQLGYVVIYSDCCESSLPANLNWQD